MTIDRNQEIRNFHRTMAHFGRNGSMRAAVIAAGAGPVRSVRTATEEPGDLASRAIAALAAMPPELAEALVTELEKQAAEYAGEEPAKPDAASGAARASGGLPPHERAQLDQLMGIDRKRLGGPSLGRHGELRIAAMRPGDARTILSRGPR